MFDIPSGPSSTGFAAREYESLLREAVSAVKGGRMAVARRILQRLGAQNPNDARVWIWLSATTQDRVEQRGYLEKAVAADPHNTAAQKGLRILNARKAEGSNRPSEALAQPRPLDIAEQKHGSGPVLPAEVSARTFECPNCGGQMRFEIHERDLICERCGTAHRTENLLAPDRSERPIVHVLHTEKAHRWTDFRSELECGKCGAHTLLEENLRTSQCPYCGSNQLVDSSALDILVDPEAIALFEVESEQAHALAKAWFNTGLFAPDDLAQGAKKLKLRPAYYPFWVFDGAVEMKWSCQVRSNYGGISSRQSEWQPASGELIEFFDDVLVPGVQAVHASEIAGIEPFNLKDVMAFEPVHLAGWPTVAYDIALADASLLAREKVVHQLKPGVRRQIEPGKEKRDVRIGGANWSGITYKQVLLPLWIGTYLYQGEEFHILVNGQTGKVNGMKPRDQAKVVGIWMIGIIGAIALLSLLVWLLLGPGGFFAGLTP